MDFKICKNLKLICFFLLIQFNYEVNGNCEDPDFEDLPDEFCQADSKNLSIADCNGAAECGRWCTNTLSTQVIDSFVGLVLFKLPLSPDCCSHTSFNVELVIHGSEVDCRETSTAVIHSKKPFSCDASSKVLEIKFMYVFDGCYSLIIQPKSNMNSRMPCQTKFVEIKTNYTKQILVSHEITPTISFKCVPLSKSVEMTVSFYKLFDDDSQPDTIIQLNSGYTIGHHDCSETATKESCCEVEQYLPILGNDDYNERDCMCMWNIDAINCRFKNIKPGNYCAFLTFFDTRCHEGTIWVPTNFSTKTCEWHYNFSCSMDSSVVIPTQYETNHRPWIFVSLIVSAAISIAAAIIYFKTSPKKLDNRYVSFVGTTPTVLVERKERVFLLYPRDCPEFMDVMSKFRTALSNSLTTQVFDLWDADLWDEVAEKGFSWARHLISEPDVKIVLAATECSKVIEKALLNGNEIVYLEPHSFDNIFPATLKSISEIYVTNTYKRILVIRIDGDNYEGDRFMYLNPFTVYTIPQHFNVLTAAVKNIDSIEETTCPERDEKLSLLISSIEIYNQFKTRNQNYLNQILHVAKKECDQ